MYVEAPVLLGSHRTWFSLAPPERASVRTPTPVVATPAATHTPVSTFTPTQTPASASSPTPTPTPTPIPAFGSRQNPVRLGTTVAIKNADEATDHWEITVLQTFPDATSLVLEENRHNDPPSEGKQYFMLTVRVRYLGPDSGHFGKVRLKSVGDSAVGYDYYDNNCGWIPNALSSPEIFKGGIVEGNVCWEIASADSESLLMYMESSNFLGGKRTWFSLVERERDSYPTPVLNITPTGIDRVVPVSTLAPTVTPTPIPTPGLVSTPADLVHRVEPGVVRVVASTGSLFSLTSGGSGFIFDVEGRTAFVATNHHVVEGTNSIDVVVGNSRTYEALVLGWDADRDVAVLSICCSEDFHALSWESMSPEPGQAVVAIGYPRGGASGQVTATTGVVSDADARSTEFGLIPHTAPLNPGNSGGPLFSMPGGKVLGINTSRATDMLRFYAVPYQSIEAQVAEWRSQLVVTE